MAEPARKTWSPDEFFAWHERQEARYELVDGEPLKMQAGASRGHNRLGRNAVLHLGNQLRGKKCQPFGPDDAVQTRPGQIRYPDFGVECGPFDPKSYLVSAPVIIAEVLSPTTRDYDTLRKAEEYKLIPSLRRILLVDPNRAEVFMWLRGETGEWEYSSIEGLAEAISMPEIEVTLRMTEIYRDIPLPAELWAVDAELNR